MSQRQKVPTPYQDLIKEVKQKDKICNFNYNTHAQQLLENNNCKDNQKMQNSQFSQCIHGKEVECNQNCLEFNRLSSNYPSQKIQSNQASPTKKIQWASDDKRAKAGQKDHTTNIDQHSKSKNNGNLSQQPIFTKQKAQINDKQIVQKKQDKFLSLMSQSDPQNVILEQGSEQKQDKQIKNSELLSNSQKLTPEERARLLRRIQNLTNKIQNCQSQKELMNRQAEMIKKEYYGLYREQSAQLEEIRRGQQNLNLERKSHKEETEAWNICKSEDQKKMLILQQNISSERALLTELINSVNPSQAQDKLKQEEIKRIKTQLNEQIDDLQKSQDAKTYLEQQIQKLKSFFNKQKEHIKDLRDKQNNLEAQLKKMRDQKLGLQQNIQTAQFNLREQRIQRQKVQQKYAQHLRNITKQFTKLSTSYKTIQEQYKKNDKDGKILIQLKEHQRQKNKLKEELKAARYRIEELQLLLKQKDDDQKGNTLLKQDNERRIEAIEKQTKDTADNLMKYLYCSIKTSQKDQEEVKDAKDKLLKKDEQILNFEIRLSQLEIQIANLQVKLKISEQERQELNQECTNSKKMLRSYQQNMKSYKLQVKDFIQLQKNKFKDALTIATSQFNKSLEDVSTHYQGEIKKEKQNQIKQSNGAQKIQQKFNQLQEISQKVKESSKNILKDQLQALSKALLQAKNQIKILKNKVQMSEKELKQQIQRQRQIQKEYKQKLSQKQKIHDEVKNQKYFFSDSISKIQDELQDKNFQKFAEELIDSQEYGYHDQIVQLILCIYSQRCNYEIKKYSQSQQQRGNRFQQIKQQNKENQSRALKMEHENELASLNTIIRSMEAEIVKYKEAIADNISIKKQYQSVQRQLDKMKPDGKNSQQLSKQLLAERNQLIVNKQQLQNELETLRKSARQNKDELRRTKQSYDSNIAKQLKAANESMKASTSALQKQISTLKKQKDIAIQQKNQLQKKFAQLEAESNKNKNKRDNLYFTQVNRNNNQYEIKYKNLQLQYTKNTSKSLELNQKIIQLERQNKKLKEAPNNQSQLQQKSWQKYQQKAKQYEETIYKLRLEKQNFRKRYQDCEETLKLQQQELKRLEIKKKPVQSELIVYPMNSGNQLFVVSTLLQDNIKGQQFLQRLIQQQAKPAKMISASLLAKLSQATKNIPLSKLISKAQIATENFLILFSTKQSIFGALALKKDAYSKQIASIFSIENEKLVIKNPRVQATGLNIDYEDNLLIGSSHMKFKLSSRVLVVKDNLMKYFGAYDKKEIYGSSYWRDELNIEINEFQIYRIYYK